MSVKKKYSKPFGDLNSLKKSFFENNDGMLDMADGMADVLLMQPKRTRCKICHAKLEDPLFTSHRIGYIECPVCGHLNSECEDTDDFASKVYIEDDYSKNYSAADRESYIKRRDMIYMPKAEYLRDCLEHDGIGPEGIDILDIGAGCGYFVSAARECGMKAVGIEVSDSEVSYGNAMAGEEVLTHIGLTDSIDHIKNTRSNVISAVGVLEHLVHLDENLEAISSNKNIRYVFASVPMFSFSSCFEVAFANGYNRHTGGTHTHLFTNESVEKMAENIGFEIAYEWRFGSDINDLYRFLMVSMQKNDNEEFSRYFSEKFIPLMDELQAIVDRSEFSSELHFILRRKEI
ncbi:MAG: methyltransferase domain-containing protein [Lachnospiraceae bacterium]|nr:methyltransferase domain-containing protein [Lachnospiraceae bacterium]MBR4574024.1 methyltransferase domain-containing protein [Lachnospiraceae bacterium]